MFTPQPTSKPELIQLHSDAKNKFSEIRTLFACKDFRCMEERLEEYAAIWSQIYEYDGALYQDMPVG